MSSTATAAEADGKFLDDAASLLLLLLHLPHPRLHICLLRLCVLLSLPLLFLSSSWLLEDGAPEVHCQCHAVHAH